MPKSRLLWFRGHRDLHRLDTDRADCSSCQCLRIGAPPPDTCRVGLVQERPPYEGLSIIVTARRRAVEIDDVGVVLLPKRTWRRRSPEWLNAEDPFRISLAVRGGTPGLMQDGQTIRGFGELESVAEELGDRDGALYAYVVASGNVYLASPNSKLRKRLRRRIGS
jgi:hypothetical protein